MVYRDPRSGRQLGEALRDWREASGVTLAQAAEHCGVSVTHLLDVENGNCGPSAAVLRNLSTICRSVPSIEREGWATVLAWLRVFNESQATTNRERLGIVANSIRQMRGLESTDRVRMRDVEGDIVVSMLDTDRSDKSGLILDVMATFGLSSAESGEMISASLRRLERRRTAHAPIASRIAADAVAAS